MTDNQPNTETLTKEQIAAFIQEEVRKQQQPARPTWEGRGPSYAVEALDKAHDDVERAISLLTGWAQGDSDVCQSLGAGWNFGTLAPPSTLEIEPHARRFVMEAAQGRPVATKPKRTATDYVRESLTANGGDIQAARKALVTMASVNPEARSLLFPNSSVDGNLRVNLEDGRGDLGRINQLLLEQHKNLPRTGVSLAREALEKSGRNEDAAKETLIRWAQMDSSIFGTLYPNLNSEFYYGYDRDRLEPGARAWIAKAK